MSKKSPYLRLETRIAADEHGGIMHRWEYGREVLKAKAGRKQLPDGMITDLIKAAERVGKKISEREIQYRIRLASVYASDQQVRKLIADFGSWSEIIKAGFPEVDVDEASMDPEDLEAAGIHTGPPDEFEQLTLIPGAPAVLRVKGREAVDLTDATLADFKAYCEQSAEITANFAKHDALLWTAYRAMLDGSGGDMDANAVEAWKRGTGEDDEAEETS